MPDAYDRLLGPSVFEPFAEDLARRAAARSPERVLELAAGTGLVTRRLLAAAPSAEIIATDLNNGMVEFGRQRAPGAAWRQADAMNLPFGPAEFDLVVCQFGVMFFPDKAGAFAQARGVLRPGGALLFNTWGELDMHDFDSAVTAGLARVFPDDPPRFLRAVPHGYADVDAVIADLAEGGFEGTVESVTLVGRATAADVAEGFCTGTPVRAEIEARGGDIAATTAALVKEVEARLGRGMVNGRMTAFVVEAAPIV
jgi:SAM-dependent methyltransferase